MPVKCSGMFSAVLIASFSLGLDSSVLTSVFERVGVLRGKTPRRDLGYRGHRWVALKRPLCLNKAHFTVISGSSWWSGCIGSPVTVLQVLSPLASPAVAARIFILFFGKPALL